MHIHTVQSLQDLSNLEYLIVLSEPAGVAALISPWNLPLYLLTWKIAPCLAFGCTAVYDLMYDD